MSARARIYDILKVQRDAARPVRSLWQGVVVSAPSDLSDRLDVVVPDFDPSFRWENCRWQSRDDHSLPAPGDPCLIALDNRNEPWVLVWWPEGFG
jgi:hypothetical protein